MGRPKPTRPTDGELEILRVLWDRGRSAVREVHEELRKQRRIGPNTVLKLMQIMTEKGILRVDRRVRPQLYEPVRSRTQTQQLMVRDLVDRVFHGSSKNLILQALASEPASEEELKAIRQLIDELEEKSQ